MSDEPQSHPLPAAGPPEEEGPAMPSSILFLCRMNAIRSPMAEALARSMLPGVFITSAGVRPGEADPFVGAVMAAEGLAQHLHPPRGLDDLDDTYFDLIVTLAPEAHHRALDMTRAHATAVEYWPTPDPSAATGTREHILAAYREVLAHLRARIAARFLAPPRK